MAQREYKLELKGSTFPMLSEQQTRTIIGSTAGESPAADEKPSVAYCHNVMPTKGGFNSVGYLTLIPAAASLPEGLSFVDTRVIYGDARSRLDIAWDSRGNAYVLLLEAAAWLAIATTLPPILSTPFDVNKITIGTVNGVSYIFYTKVAGFTYNELSNTLDPVTFAGLNIPDILGVVASSGYLIAYTDSALAWSSTLLPYDFVPDKVTGAGGGDVSDIDGKILFMVANTLGFLIYTSANIVAATYTGNAQFPFKFRSVKNSKGGLGLDLVTYEANSQEQFVYSKAGLQSVTSQTATIILPEITDFLAGKRFEDYNELTDTYEVTDLDLVTTMKKKIKFIASRYLVISYGITSFTHALVFDIALSRLGKLKLEHVDTFEYIGNQVEASKESLAFLLASGEVKTVNFSVTAESSGLIVMGKLQFTRTRMIDLLQVQVENTSSEALTLASQVSLRGKGFTLSQGQLMLNEDNLSTYNFRASGKSHSLVLKGQFNLVTLQVVYKVTGRR